MILLTLDSLVRRYLLNRNLPIHHYLETLVHSATALHELNIRTLTKVNTVKLEVSSYGAIEIPSDMMDEIGVYEQVGGKLRPIPKTNGLMPLRNRDESGAFVPHENSIEASGETYDTNLAPFFYNSSDLGEPTGGYYGLGGGSNVVYQKFPERREIQLYGPVGSYVVLKYISDGNRADNATEVDTRASRAIHTFVDWQRSNNAAYKDSPEARTYYNEERLLRASLNEITETDILDALHKAYKGGIKN